MKDFKYNSVGGVDATITLEGLGDVPYTLSQEEILSLPSDTTIAPFIESNSLEKVKQQKLLEVSTQFNIDANDAVEDSNGIFWNGGLNSATILNNKANKEEFKGNTTVTIFDYNNNFHTISILDCKNLSVLIADKYEDCLTEFKLKQHLINQATTIEEVNSI